MLLKDYQPDRKATVVQPVMVGYAPIGGPTSWTNGWPPKRPPVGGWCESVSTDVSSSARQNREKSDTFQHMRS